MFSDEQLSLLNTVNHSAKTAGLGLYLVGGIVRDIGLGLDPHDRDLDFIVEGDAAGFAESAAKEFEGELVKFPKFLTAKVLNPKGFSTIDEIDFASSRTEIYESPGKLPKVLKASISEDLKRRDFSVNAMALSIEGLLKHLEQKGFESILDSVLDPFSGLEDLRVRQIRVLHEKSFIDDPTRLFRACRYAVRVKGGLEKETFELFSQALQEGCCKTVSNYRLFKEFKKILLEEEASKIIKQLLDSGLQDHYPSLQPDSVELLIKGLENLEQVVITSAERLETGLLLCQYVEKPLGEKLLIDGQLPKTKRAEQIEVLSGLSKAVSVEVGRPGLLLRYALTQDPDALDMLKSEIQ